MSIRCRYCYSEGHNVITCESLTETVRANPGGYYHRKYSKYFNENGDRKTTNKSRTCSYCKESGHTKNTCNTRLQDTVYNVKTNAEYRKYVYSWFQEKKLGIGALVEIYNNLYTVTGIVFENFICGSHSAYKEHIKVHCVTGDSHYKDLVLDNRILTNRSTVLKVLNGSDVPTPPECWFEGTSTFYYDHEGRVKNPFAQL